MKENGHSEGCIPGNFSSVISMPISIFPETNFSEEVFALPSQIQVFCL